MARPRKPIKRQDASPSLLCISRYEVLSFAIGDAECEPSAAGDIEFVVTTELAASARARMVFVKFDIAVWNIDGARQRRSETPLLSLSTRIFFSVDRFELIPFGNGRHRLPSNMMETMVAVGYGTTRGIILARTMGTECEGLVLPITSVDALLPQIIAEETALARGI